MMTRPASGLLLAFLLTLSAPTQAEEVASAVGLPVEKPQFARIAYDAYWGPILVATVAFSLDTRAETYRTDMTIRPAGPVAWFTDNFSADLVSEGAFETDGRTRPVHFHRTWRSDKKSGDVVVHYDAATGIALGVYEGKPDDQVPEDLRKDVIDPLAVLTAARHRLLMGKEIDLGLKVYDGKRRFDMKGQVEHLRHMEFRDVTYEVIPVSLNFVPLAGFNKRQQDGWMGSQFEIMFSTDGAATPFQIYLETKLGWLRLIQVNICQTDGAPCQFAKVE